MSQKRLGKGLRDISHCFITTPEKDLPPVSKNRKHTGCRAVVVLDDLHPYESALLTLTLGWNLSGKGHGTLLVDGVMQFPRLSFSLGAATPGLFISHFLSREDPATPGFPLGVTKDGILGLEDWEPDQDRKGPPFLVEVAPRLRCLLPLLRFQDLRQMEFRRVYPFLKALQSLETEQRFILLRFPPDEETRNLHSIGGEFVFLVPSDEREMALAYRRIKQVVQSIGPGRVGMVVLGTENRSMAYQVFQKFQDGLYRFLGEGVSFLGFLPEVPHSAALFPSTSSQVLPLPGESFRAARCLEDIADRILEKGSEGVSNIPTGGYFFKRLLSMVQGPDLTPEESRFFSEAATPYTAQTLRPSEIRKSPL